LDKFSPSVAEAWALATSILLSLSAFALPIAPSLSLSETLTLASLIARDAASLPKASI